MNKALKTFHRSHEALAGRLAKKRPLTRSSEPLEAWTARYGPPADLRPCGEGYLATWTRQVSGHKRPKKLPFVVLGNGHGSYFWEGKAA